MKGENHRQQQPKKDKENQRKKQNQVKLESYILRSIFAACKRISQLGIIAEEYTELCQTSKVDHFAKILNG